MSRGEREGNAKAMEWIESESAMQQGSRDLTRAYIELAILRVEPDVGLHARHPMRKGRVQRYISPVIVVRVYPLRSDVTSESAGHAKLRCLTLMREGAVVL